MALAIFDLDNTLLAGDSDHAWGEFLVTKGAVEAAGYKEANDQFYQDYLNGTLDIQAYLEYALAPLTQHPLERLHAWRDEFVADVISEMHLEQADELLHKHRSQGDYLLIITATNRFVTEPIAARLGVDDLIATDPEFIDGNYTGKVAGVPSFQDGKVTRLQSWLNDHHFDLADAWFYSDSHNDIPLLNIVGHPVAVDADDTLQAHAERNNWQIISLR